MKPHIGLNADFAEEKRPYHKLYADYTVAVNRAGGVPVIIPNLHDDEDILSFLSSLDAVVLTGGRDIDPQVYGQGAHEATVPISEFRQQSDLRLVELALVMEMPLLGICLGCQLLNVALGGTLVQDLPSQTAEIIAHGGEKGVRHQVRVEQDSRLRGIVGAETIEVDSSHHQAIGELGKGLAVSARAEDDVIEAVELPDKWVLAVQWHPERMIEESEHLALFAALVSAGGGR